jgi:hypothetical protein
VLPVVELPVVELPVDDCAVLLTLTVTPLIVCLDRLSFAENLIV